MGIKKEEEAMIKNFSHDSIGSLSSKLELNDPNNHASSQIKLELIFYTFFQLPAIFGDC